MLPYIPDFSGSLQLVVGWKLKEPPPTFTQACLRGQAPTHMAEDTQYEMKSNYSLRAFAVMILLKAINRTKLRERFNFWKS